MSQTFNDDWEIRKSILIRSIFHDIPYRVLSLSTPSTETSYYEYPESSSYGAVTASETPSVPTIEAPGVEAPEVPRIKDHLPIVETPLPELIIEREPNKHDEPEEYYQQLLIKIRKAYRKMFIEEKSMSDDDFFTDVEQDLITGDINLNLSKKETPTSSGNNNSNGYNADCESFDEPDCDQIKNYGNVQPNDTNSSEEVSNGNTNTPNDYKIQVNICGTPCDGNNYKSGVNVQEYESCMENSEENADNPDCIQITVQALVHMDNSPGTERREITKSPILVNRHICSQTDKGLMAKLYEAADLQQEGTSSVSEKPSSHSERDDAKGTSLSSMYSFLAAERNAAMAEQDESNQINLISEMVLLSAEEHSQNCIYDVHIEAMRSVQRKATIESIQIDNTSLRSDIDITISPRYSIPNQINASQTQGGSHEESAPKTSYDNNILTNIEPENTTNTRNSEDCGNVNRNHRKRRQQEMCEEIGMDWDKLRNIFVGEPKIFRLCSCISPDHNCVN